jgi:acetyltransferase
MFCIETLTAPEAREVLPDLVALLQDTVNTGSSIGFIPPLQSETAEQYWLHTIEKVANGESVLLVSKDSKTVTGSVQLGLSTKQNGLHRAEVQKLLVHTRFRGRGIGRALLFEVEKVASEIGRTLLVLDTEQGSIAESLYETHGYQRVGVIPRYALAANGSLISTVVFYRVLSQ